jgi:hypothetical protein
MYFHRHQYQITLENKVCVAEYTPYNLIDITGFIEYEMNIHLHEQTHHSLVISTREENNDNGNIIGPHHHRR